MIKINVSSRNNNCGLYSLALAVSLALEKNSLIASNNIPDFVRDINAKDVSVGSGEQKLNELGQLLRNNLATALHSDELLKQELFENFRQAMFDKESKIDMKSLLIANEQIIKMIKNDVNKTKQMMGAVKDKLNLDVQEIPEIEGVDIAKKIASLIIEGLATHSLDHDATFCFLNGMNLHDSSADLLKLCKNIHSAFKYIKIQNDDLNILYEQFKSLSRIWYCEKAHNLIKIIQDENQKAACLWQFGKGLHYLGKGNDYIGNAIEMYASWLIENNWNKIYDSYIAYISSNNVMLNKHELTCLAAAWNVELEIHLPNYIPFILQSNITPALRVSIINTDNHWQVLSYEPAPEQNNAESNLSNNLALASQTNAAQSRAAKSAVVPVSTEIAKTFETLIRLHKSMGNMFSLDKPADIGDTKVSDVPEYQVVCDYNGKFRLRLEKTGELSDFQFLKTVEYNKARAAALASYSGRTAMYGASAAVVGSITSGVHSASTISVAATAGIAETSTTVANAFATGVRTFITGGVSLSLPLLFGGTAALTLASWGVTYEQRRFAMAIKKMLDAQEYAHDEQSLLDIEKQLKAEVESILPLRNVRSSVATEFANLFLEIIHVKICELNCVKKSNSLQIYITHKNLSNIYENSANAQIKFLALNQIIYMLSHEKFKIKKSEHSEIILSMSEKKALLDARIKELRTEYKDFVWHYFNMVWAAYGELLDTFEKKFSDNFNGNTDDAKLPLNKMLQFDGLYCLRYINDYGRLCEVLLKFSQALSNALHAQHYKVECGVQKAKDNIEEALYKLDEIEWLIKQYKLHELEEKHDNGGAFIEVISRFSSFYSKAYESEFDFDRFSHLKSRYLVDENNAQQKKTAIDEQSNANNVKPKV